MCAIRFHYTAAFLLLLVSQIVFAAVMLAPALISPHDTSLEGAIRIQPAVLNLGRLPLDTRREVHVKVFNRGGRPIQLAKPITTCGCVTAELSAPIIAAAGEADLTLTIATTPEPTDILQHVSLVSAASRTVVAQMKIEGSAGADIWAHPSSIVAELSDLGRTYVEASIRYADGKEPSRIVADTEQVHVDLLPSTAGEQRFQVSIASQIAGKSTLRVFSSDAAIVAPVLEVPVRWRPRPHLRLTPRRLVVEDVERKSPNVEKTLFVAVDRRKGKAELIVTPLVPWLKVVQQRQLNPHFYELRIGLDLTGAPKVVERNMPILAVGLTGLEQSVIHVPGAIANL
jgi:hypothetical protein